jgi:hypothetical protein
MRGAPDGLPRLRNNAKIYNNSAKFTIYFNDSLAGTFEDVMPISGIKFGLVVSVNTTEKELFPSIPVDLRLDY